VRGTVSGDQDGFDVVARISDASPANARVEYPQLSCTGTWTGVSRRGDVVTAPETIDTGTCVASQIELSAQSGDTLAYRASYYSESPAADVHHYGNPAQAVARRQGVRGWVAAGV
jgi:hypothetical protein